MIPLKLETLLKGRVVENDRVEYKLGWNPNDTIKTICSYANDWSNTNGGYVVIGISEKDGQPILPPEGLPVNTLDKVQQELIQYCRLITPSYIPQIEIVEFQGKQLVYLWCSGGDAGPYKAPENVHEKKKQYEYWIKPASVKIAAKGSEIFELYNKFNSIPFDDRVNRDAKISDIRRTYLEDYLIDSESSLAANIDSRSIADTLLALEVANATDTGVDIRNIGILMFSEKPEKFFPYAQIDVVFFRSPEREGSDDFTEKTFKGPIQNQVREALSYIRTMVIEEKVVKFPDRAEANRFYSYPYDAVEEAVVNAVFHKSYQIREPVEVRIYIDCIIIINHPGPELYIDMDDLKSGNAISRRYRNRRIGEFFKEIDLSEKMSTGIKKILSALERNGSPPPEFKTSQGREYMQVTIKMHEGFDLDHFAAKSSNEGNGDGINEGINDGINRHNLIMNTMKDNPAITTQQLADAIGVSVATMEREIRALKKSNQIGRVGARKSGQWVVL
ncbi:MAG: putative DNA binding domain-containing protein [Oscillospiraceae bacterium]|jgi:ATP-dependent DNA helicase RecG|nr:putative DNA binding domain-containing protein [Oscillospiraceae bacterium]